MNCTKPKRGGGETCQVQLANCSKVLFMIVSAAGKVRER